MKKFSALLVLLLTSCLSPPNPFNDLVAVWGSDSSHLWAVGEHSTSLRGDGREWTFFAEESPPSPTSIWGSSLATRRPSSFLGRR